MNREKQVLEVDDELENVELEELQDILPSHQPRFIVYRYDINLYFIIDETRDKIVVVWLNYRRPE